MNKIIKNEMDMTSGNIPLKMLGFAFPLIVSGMLQILFSAADLVVCAQFGSSNSVGAISATTCITNLILNIFMGLSVGSNAVMSNAYGAQDKKRGDSVLHTSIVVSIISGLAVGILGLCFSKTLLTLMLTPNDIIDLANTYLFIYFLGIPAMMVYNFASGCLRGMGDSKRPFYFLLLSGIMNVGLNFLFVITFKMDVAGVAVATVISQSFAAGAVIICLLKNKGFARLSFRRLRVNKEDLAEIVKIGIPAGIQGSFFSISNVIIQSSVNSFGSYAVTGNGASASVNGFAYVGMNGFSQTCLAFTAANYGAKKVDNIKKAIKYSVIYSVTISIVLQAIICLLAKQLMGIYTNDPAALKVAIERQYIMAVAYFAFGICDTISYADRGLGYSTTPMFISLIGICGFRILYIFTIFLIPEFHTLNWLYASFPFSWIISGIAQTVIYFIISKKAFAKCMCQTDYVMRK